MARLAWIQNCSRCHGPAGKADTEEGKRLGAKDLTRPDWQAAMSDDAIREAIRRGHGNMPGFQLPRGTVDPLVSLVRELGAPAAAGAPTASAAGSARVPASSDAHRAAP